MKKISKIISILIVIFLMICMCSQVWALKEDLDAYKPPPPTKQDAKVLTDKIGIILGVVRNISAIVAVITLTVVGVKYILGSVEEKANYKAAMMPYLVGCVLAVAGTTIVSLIYETFN